LHGTFFFTSRNSTSQVPPLPARPASAASMPLLPAGAPGARGPRLPFRATIARLAAAYETQLSARPWATQATTSAILWGAGDLLAQRLESKLRPDVLADWRRAGVNTVYGGAFIGPLGHAWLEWLEQARVRSGLGAVAAVAAKVLADTVVFGPIHVAGYLALPGLACGDSLDQCTLRVRALFWPTLAAESLAWGVVQTANFALVPVRHQLLVINLVTLADCAFLSWWKEGGGQAWLAATSSSLNAGTGAR